MFTQELIPPPAALTQPWRLPLRGLAVFHGECDAPRLSHYFLPRLVLEGKRILFLDGANCANPRLMARLAERRGVPFAQFNRQIMLARAFTCFQLTELINRVPQFLAEFPAQVLLVTAFPELYFDEDIRPADASAAFQQALDHLCCWALYPPVQGWGGEDAGWRQSQLRHEKTPHPPAFVEHPLPWERAGIVIPRPLPGGEGGPRPAPSPAGAGRVRGPSLRGTHTACATHDFDAPPVRGARDLTVAVFSSAANFHPPAGRKLFFTRTCAAATELWKFQLDEHGRLGLAQAVNSEQWTVDKELPDLMNGEQSVSPITISSRSPTVRADDPHS